MACFFLISASKSDPSMTKYSLAVPMWFAMFTSPKSPSSTAWEFSSFLPTPRFHSTITLACVFFLKLFTEIFSDSVSIYHGTTRHLCLKKATVKIKSLGFLGAIIDHKVRNMHLLWTMMVALHPSGAWPTCITWTN